MDLEKRHGGLAFVYLKVFQKLNFKQGKMRFKKGWWREVDRMCCRRNTTRSSSSSIILFVFDSVVDTSWCWSIHMTSLLVMDGKRKIMHLCKYIIHLVRLNKFYCQTSFYAFSRYCYIYTYISKYVEKEEKWFK